MMARKRTLKLRNNTSTKQTKSSEYLLRIPKIPLLITLVIVACTLIILVILVILAVFTIRRYDKYSFDAEKKAPKIQDKEESAVSSLIDKLAEDKSEKKVDQKKDSKKVSIVLPLNILKTEYGIDGAGQPSYPTEIKLPVPEELSEQVAAYGVAGEVVIGPADWTGYGKVGANGNIVIKLYPLKSSSKKGPQVTLFIPSSGTNNVFYAAAPFFSNIQEFCLEEKIYSKPLPTPYGLKSDFVTDKLNRYTLAQTDGLLVFGAAYQDVEDHLDDMIWSSYNMEVTLPVEQQDLGEFLLDFFIQWYKLDN